MLQDLQQASEAETDDSYKDANKAYHMAKKQAKSAVWSAKQAISESNYVKLYPKGRPAYPESERNQDIISEMRNIWLQTIFLFSK